MTAEPDLLPLPSWAHKADKLLCDTDWLRTQVSDYARVCVTHATAAKDAEIEALRAEVDEWIRVATEQAELHGEAEARAERLAEALRVAEAALADIGDADREPGDDVAWCERRAAQALPTARAALEQENSDVLP